MGHCFLLDPYERHTVAQLSWITQPGAGARNKLIPLADRSAKSEVAIIPGNC